MGEEEHQAADVPHRFGDVAEHHHLGPLRPAGPEHEDHRHPTPGHVPAERATNVEGPLPAAALAANQARLEALREPSHRVLHLGQLGAAEAGEAPLGEGARRPAQTRPGLALHLAPRVGLESAEEVGQATAHPLEAFGGDPPAAQLLLDGADVGAETVATCPGEEPPRVEPGLQRALQPGEVQLQRRTAEQLRQPRPIAPERPPG